MRCLFEDAYSTSCGSSGTGETPQEYATRRSPAAPRKAKRLERKSADPINRLNKIITAGKLDFIEFVYSLRLQKIAAFFIVNES
ncbi:hypothetical protein CVD28_18850 [Bacillus sp. M6-12]|nr:hypothetical protein CVD28_18850 [Bacillus sp. M6-12]